MSLMQQYKGEMNFLFGALTTLFGTAGAIVAGPTGAAAFSGAAAAATGIRAEFNQDFFSNLAIEVITNGIDARRKLKLAALEKKYDQPLKQYPVEQAIADALAYHGACSVIAGLMQANQSIVSTSDPGLEAITLNLDKLKNLNATIKAASKAGAPTPVTPTPGTPTPGTPTPGTQ